MKTPVFLTLAEVVRIHSNQIEFYGGTPGIRDLYLLYAALAQPEASFAGEWLHEDIFEMAAAYAFHLSQNRPFIDGNKRTALASALVFLEFNGLSIIDPRKNLRESMRKMTAGQLDKKELAQVFRKFSRKSEG